jgi:hypothetical protein
MGSNTPKLRAIAIREIKFSRPSQVQETRARAALSQLGESAHADLHKQADLLHVEAILVTEGINDNDDAFTRDQLKSALNSPILKPMNWQHKDDQILGAMYAVEARDLDGNPLEEIGDNPVELAIQGVVWHQLPHIKATAEQIVQRIEKGDLFVSMECWFDNYDYGLFTQAGELFDIIPRNNDTAFLDGFLRANGGVGRYNGMRLGRALTGINFGGVAFVDRPANKRSFILNQFAFDPNDILEEVGASDGGLGQDQVVTNNVVSDVNPPMEVNMNDQNRAAASRDEIQEAVERALAAEKKVVEVERTKADRDSAVARAADLESKLETAKQTLAALQKAIDHAFEAAKAAAPTEIARIDSALQDKSDSAGETVWAAKIAWIDETRAMAQKALAESTKSEAGEKLVEENALLRKELAGLKSDIRKAEVEYLFRDVLEMEDAEVDTFVQAALALESDDAYTAWLDEKKIFAKKMIEMKPKKGKDKGKECAADDTEAGLLAPTQRETPIDDMGAVLRGLHGRAPADMPRVPRSKLTAAENLDEMFEEVDEPNLAGASTDQGNSESPMGKLVAGLLRKPVKDNQDN